MRYIKKGQSMLKKINHVAIAVNNIEEATVFYQDILGLKLSGVEVVKEQKTKVAFFRIGESNIELVQPAEKDSPLVKFLETRGQGIHHICFEVDDIESEMKDLLDKGAKLIDQKPRPGAHDTKVSFIHPKSSNGVLIELCEPPKAS
jgi:methylmalonyl-CoA epimerase